MSYSGSNRRLFLKQAGLTLFLPCLESTRIARAQTLQPDLKFVAIYNHLGVPNAPGVGEETNRFSEPKGFFKEMVDKKYRELFRAWNPKQVGRNWQPSEMLETIRPVKSDISVISGTKATDDSGINIHTRTAAYFLSGMGPKGTFSNVAGTLMDGVTKTLDVMIAETGPTYPVPVLATGLGTAEEQRRNTTGLMKYHISWRTNDTPVRKHYDPVAVFKEFFNGGEPLNQAQEQALQRQYAARKSVIDLLKGQRQGLATSPKRSQADLRVLDKFWDSLREVEKELLDAQPKARQGCRTVTAQDLTTPDPEFRQQERYAQRVRAFHTLMVLALQCGLTRVATHVLAEGEPGGTRYPFHYASHYGDISRYTSEAAVLAKLSSYKSHIRDYLDSFAYLVAELKNIADIDGSSMLDNSMLLWGSTMRDPHSHTTDDCPVLLAGRAKGALNPSSHYRFEKRPDYANLLLTLAHKAGVKIQSIGHSTGTLAI